jgi:hypothetical protein
MKITIEIPTIMATFFIEVCFTGAALAAGAAGAAAALALESTDPCRALNICIIGSVVGGTRSEVRAIQSVHLATKHKDALCGGYQKRRDSTVADSAHALLHCVRIAYLQRVETSIATCSASMRCWHATSTTAAVSQVRNVQPVALHRGNTGNMRRLVCGRRERECAELR